MTETSNSPTYTVKYVEIGWSAVAAMFSLLGNTMLLLASIRHKAIKLDRVTIVLLENLAAADLGFVLFTIIPRAVYILLYNDDYMIYREKLLYKTTVIPATICTSMKITLIPALNSCKLLSLIKPFRVRNYRYRDGYRIVAFLWCAEGLFSIVTVIGTQFYLEYPTEMTYFGFTVLGVLLCITLVTTLALLLKVNNARGLSGKGILSITLVSIVFLILYVPIWINQIFKKKGNKTLGTVFNNTYYIGCFVNPVVYYICIRSLKEFVDSIFCNILQVHFGMRND